MHAVGVTSSLNTDPLLVSYFMLTLQCINSKCQHRSTTKTESERKSMHNCACTLHVFVHTQRCLPMWPQEAWPQSQGQQHQPLAPERRGAGERHASATTRRRHTCMHGHSCTSCRSSSTTCITTSVKRTQKVVHEFLNPTPWRVRAHSVGRGGGEGSPSSAERTLRASVQHRT